VGVTVLFRQIDRLFAALFGTFQRALFWELFRVFILCLIGLAGVFTMGAVLQQLQSGASLGQVLKILPLLTTNLLPYIIPPSCLFATCVVYGRVSYDNEAVALKAAGVDLLAVLRPAIALGLVAAAGTAALQFSLTPASWRQTKETLLADPEEAICLALKRERTMKFPGGKDTYVLYVRDVEDRRLLDVIVKRKPTQPGGRAGSNADDADIAVARTREARLKVDLDRKVIRLEGSNWSGPGFTRSGDDPFEHDLPPQFNLDALRKEFEDNPASVDWMQLRGMAAERAGQAAANDRLRAELAALPADKPLTLNEQADIADRVGLDVSRVPLDAGGRVGQMEHCKNVARHLRRIDLIMRHEYHLRPAMAFGCLFFAVLGCPVGLWANRADFLSIFVVCFLPALFVYYPVLFMAGGYARDGSIPMPVGVWAANAVLAVAGVVLSWRLIRR
jgi:lipopolysaccharide export system permease protein